ncbi:motility associated factor glycosyltransferase family protein [Thiomicrorhabdus sp.]|uniref:motility associated factor glycosyltransferase family protein n=1 Tax=Thiomicrorhabdus sp. TaxID=2039724 RepID=UPI0029C89E8E|nr:6-hydroxymethylpterin diphosphokinase MptE-like protein [Thiomicrorhabdus sp.]
MSSRFGALETNAFGEKFFPEINGRWFVKQSSEVLYHRYYPELLQEEDHLFIIIGSDSGLLYRFLQTHTSLPKHTHYLLIDFDEATSHLDIAEKQRDSFADSEKLPQVLLVSDQFNLANVGSYFMSYLVRNKITLLRSFAVEDAEPGSEYGQLRKKFEEAYTQLIHQELIALNSRPFVDAQLMNLADNLNPFGQMKNRLEGSVALVLGGGPTLDSAIEWIKSNQQRVVIFSAARIARRLIKEGIDPDIFVSVDPHDVSFDNSKGIFSFWNKSLLVHSYHINPKILAQWSGVSAYLGKAMPWANDEAANFDAPGPNVINTATHIAFELGCSTIIFSGVDMCFAGKQAFESGSDEAKAGGKFVFKEVLSVENNAGEQAQTQPRYALGRDMLEMQVNNYLQQKPAMQFLTLGRESAKMARVTYVSPQELQLQGNAIQFEIETMIDALRLDGKQRQSRVQSVIGQLKKQIKRFHSLHSDAEAVLALIPKMYDRFGQEDSKVLKKFFTLKKSVDKAIGEDGDMLFHYENKPFSANFKSIEDESAMSQNEIQDQLQSFYSGVKAASSAFHKSLLKAVEMAELRLSELKGHDLKFCIAKWQELEQPGRALLWLNWHPLDRENENGPLLDQCVADFMQLIENTQTKKLAELEQTSQSLPSLFNRALKAFENRDGIEVEDIIQHLQQMEDKQGLQDLIHFCFGLKQELQANWQDALHEYLKIEFASIRHPSLKRALNVSMQLQDNQLSLQLLEQLCHYSLDYMLPYANLLDLLGQKEFSAEVLNMYLQQKPENDSVRVQLAQKLMELQHVDLARQHLQQVVDRHPEHKTALHLLSQL